MSVDAVNFDEVENILMVKLILYKKRNYRLVQIQRICRLQIKRKEKKNILEKGENAVYMHFLLFQQFSKDLFIAVAITQDCVVKDLGLFRIAEKMKQKVMVESLTLHHTSLTFDDPEIESF